MRLEEGREDEREEREIPCIVQARSRLMAGDLVALRVDVCGLVKAKRKERTARVWEVQLAGRLDLDVECAAR